MLSDPVNVSPEDLNNPDYINIIGNAIAGINPQDIERIDVLKMLPQQPCMGHKLLMGLSWLPRNAEKPEKSPCLIVILQRSPDGLVTRIGI